MHILGISAFYHDSAACLVKDGKIVSAAQEERFTRVKHDSSFPKNAVNFCLDHSRLKTKDLDIIAYYEKPFLKFERLLETYLEFAPRGLRSFLKSMPLWIKQKLWIKEMISKELGHDKKIIFVEHHESHAASAFFPSPFERAAFITVDGVGEWTTTSYGQGSDNQIKILAELSFPHSLGLLYSAFTYYTGFKVNSGEYKLMGLAPYGQPKYKKIILEKLIDVKADGSFRLNMEYFNFGSGLTMTNEKFHKLFGGPPRKPESKISQQDMDIAKSIQEATEFVILKIARHVRQKTSEKNLCLAGGVALNCVANGKLLKENLFEKVWVQPAAGDAGGALGAAIFAWHQYLGNKRFPNATQDSQNCSFLGPCYSEDYILNFLEKNKIPHTRLSKDEIFKTAAGLLAEKKVVGWFSGRMEYGPRALGARSIIGDARLSEMQSVMNLKIKFRESFRPFAPAVLEEKMKDYFDISSPSPYMLFVADVKNEKRKNIAETPRIETNENSNSCQQKEIAGKNCFEKLKIDRSEIPAVTHVDYSARVQTVNKNSNPAFYHLIKEFYDQTGCPVIINTSFNVRGEPIVLSPEDATRCFLKTNIDYLFLENFLLDKSQMKQTTEKYSLEKLKGTD